MNIFIIVGGILIIPLFLFIRYAFRGANYGLIARNIVRSYNAFRFYYKKGIEYDIAVSLELSIVFSQVIYMRNGEMKLEWVRELAKVESGKSNNEELILLNFIKRMMYEIFIIDTNQSYDLIYKEISKREKLIIKIIRKTLNTKPSRNTLLGTYNLISKNPKCYEGIYDSI